MKRILFLLIALLLCTVALYACGHTHEYGEWEQTVAPGCVSEGEEVRKCACGESETRSVAATGIHSFGKWKTLTAATCKKEGTEKRECACGESELQTIPALGRCDYDAWNICKNCHEELVYTKGLAYTILEENRETCRVTGPGVGNSTLTELIIPPYIEGRRVVAVSGLGYNDTLVSVTLPDTLKTIEERAFRGCTSLIDIVIPEGVEQIGSWAFYECTSLQSVTFSEDCRIEVLEYRVFEGCSALCYFKIPESIRTIRRNTFDGCTSLRVLDKDIVYVDNWAVAWEYHGREGLALRANTVGIADYAFEGIGAAPFLVIPQGVKYIGDYALYNHLCETISISKTVVSIGKQAFGIGEALRKATFEDPSGWTVSTTVDGEGPAVNLSSHTTNVTLLSSTYADYYWRKG